ncbi:FmdB family zinc ribbon protein [Uliginosibacterium sp. H1]|uniref:FmdB family zinc ribbon protein n=1 Tax=Uliginosibacterium sp. H1 TaxID=3114757 RepID=UPI002E184663|nr:zinc ribbon domain-containing protein [Uliginosibacterium sp. H1]
MPIYEYRCGDCGHHKEHLQKFSDAPIAACPACGGSAYQKLLSAAGFQLKGSGWYATDFKGASSGGKTTPASTEAPKSEAAKSDASGGSTPCGGGCACH